MQSPRNLVELIARVNQLPNEEQERVLSWIMMCDAETQPRRRRVRRVIVDLVSHPVVVLANGVLAFLAGRHAPDELMAGMLMGAAIAAPIIIGDLRRVNVLGSPRRRSTDRSEE